MKIFSLKKEDIHISPSKKIIKKNDLEVLLDVTELLEKANKEAFDLKERTKNECEELKEEAKKEGFSESLEKLNIHILRLDDSINKLELEYKDKVLSIALKAAKKIVGEELKLNNEAIVQIVKNALKPVREHQRVKIFVNKSDFEILKIEKQVLLDSLLQVKSFSIEPRDDIEKGGCIIETEAGIINAQLETQFRAIQSAFEKFMKKP